MHSTMRRVMLSGVLGGWIFGWIVHQAADWMGAPPTNLAQWAGTFLILNLAIARVVGEILLGGVGLLLALWFRKFWISKIPGQRWQRGLLFGLIGWGFWMVIGLPVFDHFSPLVQNGLILAPGIFALRYGPTAPLAWLMASLAYGAAISIGSPPDRNPALK